MTYRYFQNHNRHESREAGKTIVRCYLIVTVDRNLLHGDDGSLDEFTVTSNRKMPGSNPHQVVKCKFQDKTTVSANLLKPKDYGFPHKMTPGWPPIQVEHGGPERDLTLPLILLYLGYGNN
jgi:hypothetical protein